MLERPQEDDVRLAEAVSAVLGEGAELRRAQARALTAVAERDTLLVARAGAGKTAVYQIASRLGGGLTLVVSPLLSLQRNQLQTLEEAGHRAALLNSTLRASEQEDVLERAASGGLEMLLLAPEQLVRQQVVEALGRADVRLVVVDEAHCVSDWGHDFRPDYLQVGPTARRLGDVRVLALTATASPAVRRDVVDKLEMRDPEVVVDDVDRPNIHLAVRPAADRDRRDAAVVERVRRGRTEEQYGAPPGAGIVYAQTRSDAEHIAHALREEGLEADVYHAGLKGEERDAVADRFLGGRSDLVVATSAFGMGVDRADVRFVVHAGPPPNLDSYYQEIGRAGRDGDPAWALLVHTESDASLGRFYASGGGPRPATVRGVVAALQQAGPQGLSRSDLAERSGVTAQTASRALGPLTQEGLVGPGDEGRTVWRGGDVTGQQVVDRLAQARERRQRLDTSAVEVVERYLATKDCRRRLMLEMLGEEHPQRCENCDRCDAGTASDVVEATFRPGQRVSHSTFGAGQVSAVDADTVTVLFDDEGYRTLSADLVESEHLLEHA